VKTIVSDDLHCMHDAHDAGAVCAGDAGDAACRRTYTRADAAAAVQRHRDDRLRSASSRLSLLLESHTQQSAAPAATSNFILISHGFQARRSTSAVTACALATMVAG
jgi:hypothetical protein